MSTVDEIDAYVTSVREVLNGIGLKIISDSTVQVQVTTADTYIANRKIDGALDAIVDLAVVRWAAYLSALAYYSQVTREMATLPVANEAVLEELRRVAMGFLRSVLPDDDDMFDDNKKPQDPVHIPQAVLTRSFDQIDGVVSSD